MISSVSAAMMLHGHTYPPLPVKRWGDTEIRHVAGTVRDAAGAVAAPAPD